MSSSIITSFQINVTKFLSLLMAWDKVEISKITLPAGTIKEKNNNISMNSGENNIYLI
jgi:hypothetical protein